MEDERPKADVRRLRLSLLNALLLMTIVGLAIVVVQLWREAEPLRAELRGLRDEVGRLSIDDPAKPHAMQVRTGDKFAWKWRIWVPEGQKYRVKVAMQDIPATGFSTSNGMIALDKSGETWIEYRISRDPKTDHWMDEFVTEEGSVGSSSQPWVTWERSVSTTEGVGKTTRVFEPGVIIPIVRHRVSEKVSSSAGFRKSSCWGRNSIDIPCGWFYIGNNVSLLSPVSNGWTLVISGRRISFREETLISEG